MITLIIDKHDIGEVREIKSNVTLKELGAILTELSAKYILVFDTVRNINPAVGCDMYVTAVAKR